MRILTAGLYPLVRSSQQLTILMTSGWQGARVCRSSTFRKLPQRLRRLALLRPESYYQCSETAMVR